ncbi:hypothetical protein FRC12_014500 [Ceratobasidium sp. 428]|nr:hypothetical protein FRC12_014500 [Ceratobasidium sp. 428]
MGLPIRLDISNEDVTRSLSGYRAQAKWDKFMTRAIRRVHSLNIINSLPSPKTLLCDTLRVLLEHDPPRIIKVLRIQRLFAGEFADPSLEILLAASQSSGILGSITVLHLSNILLPWTSAAYHNLTDLRLEFTASEGAEISTSQLGGILAASPELVVLKLEFIRIRQSIHWDTDDVVRPVHLEVLYLGYMDYESWVALLSVLSLSDCLGALEVCFGPALERISHPVRDFLRGVHVKTLAVFSLGSGSSPQWVLSLSTTIPSLKSLILSDYNPDTNGLEAATSGDSEANIDNTPHLPHLFLVTSDNLYLEELKLIVSVYGVRTLHLDGLRRYRRIPNVKRPEDLETALLQLFPSLTCILSDEDTTRHWPCRTTFDQDGATT